MKKNYLTRIGHSDLGLYSFEIGYRLFGHLDYYFKDNYHCQNIKHKCERQLLGEAQEALAVVVLDGDDAHFAEFHHGALSIHKRDVCQAFKSTESYAAVVLQIIEKPLLFLGEIDHHIVRSGLTIEFHYFNVSATGKHVLIVNTIVSAPVAVVVGSPNSFSICSRAASSAFSFSDISAGAFSSVIFATISSKNKTELDRAAAYFARALPDGRQQRALPWPQAQPLVRALSRPRPRTLPRPQSG